MNRQTNPEWEWIYRTYYRKVYEYCRYRIRHEQDAEDIASDAFCLLFDKWEQYDTHDEKAILSFLYRSANYKIQERGKEPALLFVSAEMDIDSVSGDLPIDYAIEENSKYDGYISDILRSLPAEERALFTWVVIDKRSYADIAGALGVSENTVKLRWYRLRRKMKPLVQSMIEK